MTAPEPTQAVELPRRAFDEYPTPFPVALAAVRRLARAGVLSEGLTVLEPCCGHENHWITALRVLELERGWVPFRIWVTDIQPTAVAAARRPREVPDVPGVVVAGADYWQAGNFHELAEGVLAPCKRRGRRFDLVLGNPPYAKVEPGKKRGPWVVDKWVGSARRVGRWVSFLTQQQAFTSSRKPARVAWATEPATKAWVREDYIPRISFTGTGTGQFDSTQATWGPCEAQPGRIPHDLVPWQEEGVVDAEALRAAWAARRAA